MSMQTGAEEKKKEVHNGKISLSQSRGGEGEIEGGPFLACPISPFSVSGRSSHLSFLFSFFSPPPPFCIGGVVYWGHNRNLVISPRPPSGSGGKRRRGGKDESRGLGKDIVLIIRAEKSTRRRPLFSEVPPTLVSVWAGIAFTVPVASERNADFPSSTPILLVLRPLYTHNIPFLLRPSPFYLAATHRRLLPPSSFLSLSNGEGKEKRPPPPSSPKPREKGKGELVADNRESSFRNPRNSFSPPFFFLTDVATLSTNGETHSIRWGRGSFSLLQALTGTGGGGGGDKCLRHNKTTHRSTTACIIVQRDFRGAGGRMNQSRGAQVREFLLRQGFLQSFICKMLL